MCWYSFAAGISVGLGIVQIMVLMVAICVFIR
jgi:hypothetical protein